MRLDTFLTEACIGTKQEVKTFIRNGEITVNGLADCQPFYQVKYEDVITYKGQILKKNLKYYMFYKPLGCITARSDENKKTVFDYFAKEDVEGLFPVGRLDKDTEGLLLLTNDGAFCNRIMDPKGHVPKRYYMVALGEMNEEKIRKLEEGVYINPGEKPTKPGLYERDTRADKNMDIHRLVSDIPREIIKKYGNKAFAGYLTITEGRKHQVRKMMLSVGCYVVFLRREAIGNIVLDPELKPGEYKKIEKI